MTEHPRLFVVGYYGFKNLGDEAILASMVGGLRGAVPGARIVVTSGDPEDTVVRHAVDAVHWRDISGIVKEAAACDVVILGGGGLFLDFWGFAGETLLTRDHWGLPFFAGPAVLAAVEGKPLLLYAVGVESLSTPEGRETTAAIFDLSWAATVRDGVSAGYVAELGVDSSRIEVTADPVFGLLAREPLLERESQQGSDSNGGGGGPTVGVALRSWSLAGASETWVTEVANAIESFVTRRDGRALLIPFQALENEGGYDDRDIASKVASEFGDKERLAVVEVPSDAGQAASHLASCDIVLGMRYHAVLLAAAVGKPVVALEYAPKIRGLMEQLGSTRFSLPMDAIDSETIGGLLEEAWESRGDLGKAIRGAAKNLALSAERNNQLVQDLIRGGISRPDLTPRARALVAKGTVAAVLRAEERTSEALALANQRNGLVDQRDGLKGELDALKKERDALESDRDGLEVERDRLIGEKATLAEELQLLVEANAELQGRHAELQGAHEELRELFNRITSTRSYRAMSAVWTVRGHLAELSRAVRGQLGRWRRKDRPEAGKPARLRPQSWQAFLLDRHKRELVARFGATFPARDERREAGLVSVIIVANDSGSALSRTLASVLAQSSPSLQVLVASSDAAIADEPTIAEAIAADRRVKFVAGSGRGEAENFWLAFRESEGALLCWLQSGEVLAEGALEKMAGALARHPRCDAVSSDIAPLGGETPGDAGDGWAPHSEPARRSDLRTLNIAPPARPTLVLLCRRRVLEFLAASDVAGGVPFQTDLVMRINELFTVGWLPPKPALAFGSPSSPEGAAERPTAPPDGLVHLAVFDDFRRHLLLGPVLWSVKARGVDGGRHASALKTCAADAGNLLIDDWRLLPPPDGRLWLPTAVVTVVGEDAAGIEPEDHDPPVLNVLVQVGEPRGEAPPGWDLAVAIGRSEDIDEGSGSAAGWWSVDNNADAVRFVDLAVLSRQAQLVAMEAEVWKPDAAPVDATVVVCTHKAIPPLARALASLVVQDIAPDRFEVILVNNNPEDRELRAVLDRVLEEHFAAGPIEVREVACPVKGLSAARNTGISAARGEVLLFLDDDAVAPSSWVGEAIRLFHEHPDAGVIGGHIRLVPPEPRPEVLQPGWGRYWSELLPADQDFHFVDEWWDFPWGASWCARRSTLLQIGGFRSRFGRTRGDFAGGEEVVAAALAQRLGWKIARAPQLTVEHHVVGDRYTWRHVRQTIRAGTLGNYRAQREMYIPMDSVWWTLRCLLSPAVDRTVGANTAVARLRHWSYRKAAWLRLLRWQVADELRRLRRPILGRRCG